jgi:NADH-quinone oxidoreductase subunit E
VSSYDRPGRDVSGLGNIAAGIGKDAHVTIGSDVGDLIGALNDGATIQVQGCAGKYAADGMTSGEVTINGDVDDGAGTAMRGGTLIIKGDAKNHLGHLQKGGTIVVGGSVKHYAGSFMIAGTIIIGGDAGRELGSSMIGGTIYIQGNHQKPDASLIQAELAQEDLEFLEKLFAAHQLDLTPEKFVKIVTRSKGMKVIQDNEDAGTTGYADETAVDLHKRRMAMPDVVNSNLISVLQDIQAEYGYVPEAKIRDVAQKLKIPLVDVYGVVTFYKSFSLAPRGRHSITVCLGTACHVRSSPRVLQRISEILQIEPGETTEDQEFSLEAVNCLGCCALGPMVVVDGKHHGMMNSAKVDALLRNYRYSKHKVKQTERPLEVPVQRQLVR